MIYSTYIEAKTKETVPLFLSGKPMHSKYNPANEATSFAKDVTDGFIIVLGIGGGFHIQSLLSRIGKESFILAVEADEESLAFCKNITAVRAIENSSHVAFCTANTVKAAVLAHYLPALYGNLNVLVQRAWEAECGILCEQIKESIRSAITAVSADFSVQSHFGGLWQRNILLNLAHGTELNARIGDMQIKGKTAAVIAAGPSLEKSILRLAQNRAAYCVIATDTAYGPLLAQGIHADAVVSVDAQRISLAHFYPCPKASDTHKPLFVFDACSNPDAVRFVKSKGNSVLFVKSGHPLLSALITDDSVTPIDTGSGTVTIAACDFAKLLGAERIELFGADFCYNSGKAYSRGTYLEDIYGHLSNRYFTAETQYAALMFRTPLEKIRPPLTFSQSVTAGFTSPVLKGYEESVFEWAKKNNYAIQKNGIMLNKQNKPYPFCKAKSCTTFSDNFNKFYASLEKAVSTYEKNPNFMEKTLYPILPYIAHLKKSKKTTDKLSFFMLLKLAYYQITRYTRLYEK